MSTFQTVHSLRTQYTNGSISEHTKGRSLLDYTSDKNTEVFNDFESYREDTSSVYSGSARSGMSTRNSPSPDLKCIRPTRPVYIIPAPCTLGPAEAARPLKSATKTIARRGIDIISRSDLMIGSHNPEQAPTFHLPSDLMREINLQLNMQKEYGEEQKDSPALAEAKRMVRARKDPNEPLDGGLSPLMKACIEKHYDVVEYLAQLPAVHLEPTERNGRTALLVATRHCNLQAVKLLVKYGANCNHKDRNGWSALMLAARYGSLPLVSYLASKIDINDMLPSGMSVLMKAIRYDNYKIVKFLVDNEADLNIRDKAGNTALMIAARYNRFRSLKYLLAKCAVHQLFLRNAHGKTAREVAQDNGNTKVEVQLRRREAEFAEAVGCNSIRRF